MADKIKGKITQIIGAVLDIKFGEGGLPDINTAIKITKADGDTLTVEVAQHLGDDTVRCIAMGPTDGLVRGMEAVSTGAPITVPVGENTLGRIFNVLSNPLVAFATSWGSRIRTYTLNARESKSRVATNFTIPQK